MARTRRTKPRGKGKLRLVKREPPVLPPIIPEVIEVDGSRAQDEPLDAKEARERQRIVDLDLHVQRLLSEHLTFNEIASITRRKHGVGHTATRNSIVRVRAYMREREARDKWLKRQESLEWLYRTRRKAMKGKAPDLSSALVAQRLIVALEGTEMPKKIEHTIDEKLHEKMIDQELESMSEEEVAALDAEWEETQRLATIARAQIAASGGQK